MRLTLCVPVSIQGAQSQSFEATPASADRTRDSPDNTLQCLLTRYCLRIVPAMAPYKYSVLDHKRSEIRVLTLLPEGNSDEPLRCSLRNASLDDSPRFEALSYVWGPPTPSHDILLNGVSFSVGPNLFAALRALRHRKKPRVVWADAICINQQDNGEKAYQVPLMGRIYTEAARTLIWFGDSNEDVDALISWLHTHGSTRSLMSVRSSTWLKLGAKTLFSEKAAREKDMLLLRAATGYFDLLIRPYWYRMWTFQEYLLPRDDPICYCGAHEFTMGPISEVKDRLIEGVADVGGRLSSKLGVDGARLEQDKPFMDWAEAVQRQLTTISARSGEAKSAASVFTIRRAYTESRTLAYYLGMTIERECYMAHDKFYALYGILPALQAAAPADYDKPFPRVVLELTAHAINAEETKNIYYNFGLRPNRLRGGEEGEGEGGYPTWAPDFTRAAGHGEAADGPGRYVTDEHVVRRLYEDGPPLRDAPRATVEGAGLRTLRAHGLPVGVVAAVRRFPETVAGVFAEMYAMLLSGEGWAEEAYGGGTRGRGRMTERLAAAAASHMRRFLEDKTGAGGVVGLLRETVSEVHGQYAAGTPKPRYPNWWGSARGPGDFEYLAGRTSFVTDNGLVGLGVMDIEEGDVVAVLKREMMPIVLRPSQVEPLDEEQRSVDGSAPYKSCQMVGTAYVDGIIDNEWLDRELVEELSRKPSVGFCIQ